MYDYERRNPRLVNARHGAATSLALLTVDFVYQLVTPGSSIYTQMFVGVPLDEVGQTVVLALLVFFAWFAVVTWVLLGGSPHN